MKETKNLLMGVFVAGVVLVLIIVCLYETETILPGLLATDKQSEFLLTFLMELATLGCAFLALRLFKFEKIHQELTTGKADAISAVMGRHLIILFIYEHHLRLSGYHPGIVPAVCLSKYEPL